MRSVASVEVLLDGVRVGELICVPRRGTFFAYDEQWLATGFKKQTQTLTQLHCPLLPRLLSGHLRLPEAEILIQEAA